MAIPHAKRLRTELAAMVAPPGPLAPPPLDPDALVNRLGVSDGCFIGCVCICHRGDADFGLAAFAEKCGPEAVTKLEEIVGHFWKVGVWNGKTCFRQEGEPIL